MSIRGYVSTPRHPFEAAEEVFRGEDALPVLKEFAPVAEGRRARVFVEDPVRVDLLSVAEDVLDDLHAVLGRGPPATATGDVDVLAPTLCLEEPALDESLVRLVKARFPLLAAQLAERGFVVGGDRARPVVDLERLPVEPGSDLEEENHLGAVEAVRFRFLEWRTFRHTDVSVSFF